MINILFTLKKNLNVSQYTHVLGLFLFLLICSFFPEDDLSYKMFATKFENKKTGKLEFKAEFAVDRNTKTCMRTDPIGFNDPEKTTWWKVDLINVSSIHSIGILFKNYDGYGMDFVWIDYQFCVDAYHSCF